MSTVRQIQPKSKPAPAVPKSASPTKIVNGMAVFGLRPGVRHAA